MLNIIQLHYPEFCLINQYNNLESCQIDIWFLVLRFIYRAPTYHQYPFSHFRFFILIIGVINIVGCNLYTEDLCLLILSYGIIQVALRHQEELFIMSILLGTMRCICIALYYIIFLQS